MVRDFTPAGDLIKWPDEMPKVAEPCFEDGRPQGQENGIVNPGVSFREQQAFERFARELVRLPVPGEGPLDYLLPEARWRELGSQVPDEAAWLMALSQATGVYFFPSREWVETLMRYLQLLRVTRLLEAGAGRGYLSAALAPLCTSAGIKFLAIDKGDGEFVSGLPVYAGVERGDAYTCVREFKPEVVVYAWPPPGQSVAAICQMPFVHYLMLSGRNRRRRHRSPGGLADLAAPVVSGFVPLWPGTDRQSTPPGDRLLWRREKVITRSIKELTFPLTPALSPKRGRGEKI